MKRLPFSTLLLAVITLIGLTSSKSFAKPVVIFVNGQGGCCATDMAKTSAAEALGPLVDSLGMKYYINSWNSFTSYTNDDFASATNTFVRQGKEYLDSLASDTDVYLIGHSWGGDSILNLVTSYRRVRGKRINFRLVAVIDPVGTAGMRRYIRDQYRVPKYVEYFYNVWQENSLWPIDFKMDGTLQCDAGTCYQHSNNYYRNADGSDIRANCGWHEIGCNDRRENPLNARPGWKKKRSRHQDLATDGYVLRELGDIIRAIAAKPSTALVDLAEVPPQPLPPPAFSGPPQMNFNMKVGKSDSPTLIDSVALNFNGGSAPYVYELTSAPSSSIYFSFDPLTGTFVYRPSSAYGSDSFGFTALDAKGVKIASRATITFDRFEIYPGHPPLTKLPETPLPAAINPIFSITHEQTGQVRRLDYTSNAPADILVVRNGSLKIEAEAFLENLDESYAGLLSCTVDWNNSTGTPETILDNDDYPKNYFVQKTLDLGTLQTYAVTFFRLTCMAPDMPFIIRDIPVIYYPDSVPPRHKGLEAVEHEFAGPMGEKLRLEWSKEASSGDQKVYRYSIKSKDCTESGTLSASNSSSRINVNGGLEGVLVDGGSGRMAWLNVPVCGSNAPILWINLKPQVEEAPILLPCAEGYEAANDGSGRCVAITGSSAGSPGFGICRSKASDPDGDGWGWEDNASCQIAQEGSTPVVTPSAPTTDETNFLACAGKESDPDGDGWGWENNQSCKVASKGSLNSLSLGQLVSTRSGKCVEVPLGHYERNEYLQTHIWDCYAGDNTRFNYDGQSLRSPNNRCLTVVNKGSDGKGEVHSTPCNGLSSQRFTLGPEGKVETGDGLCLVSADAIDSNGSRLRTDSCMLPSAKVWNFKRL